SIFFIPITYRVLLFKDPNALLNFLANFFFKEPPFLTAFDGSGLASDGVNGESVFVGGNDSDLASELVSGFDSVEGDTSCC
mgnify:CR=1